MGTKSPSAHAPIRAIHELSSDRERANHDELNATTMRTTFKVAPTSEAASAETDPPDPKGSGPEGLSLILGVLRVRFRLHVNVDSGSPLGAFPELSDRCLNAVV